MKGPERWPRVISVICAMGSRENAIIPLLLQLIPNDSRKPSVSDRGRCSHPVPGIEGTGKTLWSCTLLLLCPGSSSGPGVLVGCVGVVLVAPSPCQTLVTRQLEGEGGGGWLCRAFSISSFPRESSKPCIPAVLKLQRDSVHCRHPQRCSLRPNCQNPVPQTRVVVPVRLH